MIRLKVLVVRDERVAGLLSRSATVACEAVGAIRTVASLTRERGIVENYERELRSAEKTSLKQDLFGNAALAVSTCSSFFVLGASDLSALVADLIQALSSSLARIKSLLATFRSGASSSRSRPSSSP